MNVVQSLGTAHAPHDVQIILCDIGADMVDAWQDAFFGIEGVEIAQGDIMAARADAVVSPANSFGDMGGGVDKRIDDACNGHAQEAIAAAIAYQFFGELPVGMALVVTLPGRSPKFVVAAPTMRTPSDVANTLNAYHAFRAALVAILKHNSIDEDTIRSVAVSGLCTGVGKMPCAVAAHQMRAAYDNVVGGGWKKCAASPRWPQLCVHQ